MEHCAERPFHPTRIGTREGRGGRARVDRDAFVFRELDGLGVQHLRARFRELLRLLVGERVDAPRLRHHARVRRVHAVDVRADLAPLCAEGRRHRHSGRVAPTPAERRHLAAIRHALIAGDDHDAAARELVLHAEGADFDDSRIHVPIVRDDARLAAGKADGVAARARGSPSRAAPWRCARRLRAACRARGDRDWPTPASPSRAARPSYRPSRRPRRRRHNQTPSCA